MEAVIFFAVGLCRFMSEFAAPAFLAPGIAGGRTKERSLAGDAGGYDAHV